MYTLIFSTLNISNALHSSLTESVV